MAEKGVHRVKKVIIKAAWANECVDRAVAEFRNSRMLGQPAPSELFFRRQVRGELPKLRTKFDVQAGEAQREATRRDLLEKGAKGRYSKPLEVGQPVWIQAGVGTKHPRWDIEAVITEVRELGLSYLCTGRDGSKYLRNRRFLKPRHQEWNSKHQGHCRGDTGVAREDTFVPRGGKVDNSQPLRRSPRFQ